MEGNRPQNPEIAKALLQAVVNQRVSENLNRIVEGGKDVINRVPGATVTEKLEAEYETLRMIEVACNEFLTKMRERLDKKMV